MFRDAKPFTAQQSFVARSLFPPNPQTVLGALRTAALEHAGVDFREYAQGKVAEDIKARWGDPTRRTLGTLSIQGPFVARRTNTNGKVERLFRVPLDVVQHKADKKENRRYELLKPASSEDALGFECDPPFAGWRPLAASEGQWLEDATGWLSEAVYGEYLKGKVPTPTPQQVRDKEQVLDEEQVFVREERVGLGLNYERRANAASQFYQAQFVRLGSGIGLLAHVRAEAFPDAGVFKLGGEGRSASYETVTFTVPSRVATSGRLKLVLLTPAYFTGGWQPATGDWSAWVGGGKLVSVALGKPHYVSGWDLATQRAKPLRHYVPAGSVYFFEGAQLQDRAFTETPDNDLDHTAMGYGAVAVGVW
jgi:CRISPR-associated protein Cmr3